MDELRRYELYVIFQPELEDDELEARIDRVNGILTGNNGEIVEVVRKGKRRLAYQINGHNHGIDVVYQANLPPSALETLERQFNLYEEVIRYLFVRREDLEKAQRAAETAAPAAESTPATESTPEAPATTEEAPAEENVPAEAESNEE